MRSQVIVSLAPTGRRALMILVLFGLALAAAACDTGNGAPAPTPTPTPRPPEATATQAVEVQPTATPYVPQGPEGLPVGFPVDPTLRPLQVVETAGGKQIAPPDPDGPTVLEVVRDIQTRPQNDALSNRYGWNCRVHERHEGAPGVDWYLPEGTPLFATMSGQAELYFITTSNAFEYYGVDPGLTLGLPDPGMPLFPLPGPGGGMGIFVSILNGGLRAEYGHLETHRTVAMVEEDAFVAPFSSTFDFESYFHEPIGHLDITLVATWPVERGEVVGFVGNTGYSDVDHIHYQIITSDRSRKFCPTFEPYPFNGWLFEAPSPLP